MRNVFPEMAGRYVLPSEGVTLATLGVTPYSSPPEDWDGDDRASFGSAEVSGRSDVSPFGAMPWAASETTAPGAGISFADTVRTIRPTADPGAWREDNRAPFWVSDDQRALSGQSFDDLVSTIEPIADPDLWREGDRTRRYAGWDDAAGYTVPFDPRAVARGAVRVPELPEDVAEWGWHDRSPGRVGGAETPAQLASMLERWIGLELLGADFTPHGRGGYPSVGGGGGASGGGKGAGGGSGAGGGGSNASGAMPPSLDEYLYRAGRGAPSNLTPRPGEDLSFWRWLANPYPLPPGGRPVFRPGDHYIVVDPSKLPRGAAYLDNAPPGHVTVWRWIPVDVIKKAIVDGGKLPK